MISVEIENLGEFDAVNNLVIRSLKHQKLLNSQLNLEGFDVLKYIRYVENQQGSIFWS
jgi:hypothetical protein